MFASLDNMVRHFVNEHYEAWIGENLKSIRISAELVLKNRFVGEPVNEREENWYSDMNPRYSRGIIKRCFNCDSVRHLVNQCTDFYSDYKDAEDNEHEQTFESISETDFEEENWFANGEVDFYGDNERDEYGGRVNEDFYEGCEGEDCDIGGHGGYFYGDGEGYNTGDDKFEESDRFTDVENDYDSPEVMEEEVNFIYDNGVFECRICEYAFLWEKDVRKHINRLHVLSRGSKTRGKYYGNRNRDGGGGGWNRDSGGNG